ncbi:septum formation inhibitor Maf [Halomonas aquamarina]|uniref:Septum formation inhibitor Maf n=1 Tax=Vreelandella aquamarina TaxID=77097 RepID=A0ACC5VQW3_9GAMM|nr:Maf family protein [Halomonas aquamarina]MBZ5486635.1 septum formation inhibitor Maf [Halomonas aquamarina]
MDSSSPQGASPVLCLASASPRRRDLLASIGVPVSVLPSDVDETPYPGEQATAYVTRLAIAKANAAIPHTPLPTLGSDTAVVIDGAILGKPVDASDAAAMLRRLSGRTHQVVTAVAVTGPCGVLYRCVSTDVALRRITAQEIDRYWLTGEPADKAGGYAIQGLAAVFVEAIKGSYSAVVGLPLHETAQLLHQQGVPIWMGHYNSHT